MAVHLMVDTATISTRGFSVNSDKTVSYSESSTASSKCRVVPVGANETVTGDRMREEQAVNIYFPPGTTITADDVVTVSSVAYRVKGVHPPSTSRFYVKAICERMRGGESA